MPNVKNLTRQALPPPGLRRHVALTLVLLLCTALGGVLHAQGLQPPLAGTVTGTLLPPAGTIIRNHAIIQFQRENDEVPGRIYDAPSNEVLIEILPVYNIEILPDGDAPGQGSGAPPGQLIRTVATSGTGTPTTRVVINYTLHFTGNASDNVHVIPAFAHGPSDFLPKLPDGDTGMLVFSDVDANGVYDSHDVQIASWRDSNSNGQIDAGEVQLTPLGRQFPPGTVFPLHLVFRVPPDTPAGANCFVGLEGTSVADSSAVDPKSPDSIQNIVQVQVVDDAVVHISKDANVTQAVPGNVIAYTVTAKNVGKAAAKPIPVHIEGVTYQGVAIADILPTLSTGEPVPVTPASIIAFPPDGVTGTFHFSNQTDFSKPENDPSWNWHSTYQTGDTVIAYITSDGTNHYGLGIGKEIIFKFDVPVPSGPEYTDQYPLINVAHCRYDTNGLGVQTVKSNEVPVNVQGPLGVLVRDTDFEAQRPPLTPANDSVVDRQTIQVAQAGTFVYFTNRILNKGAGYETFNICLDPDATINPNKWSVTFFKSDGVTPLRDSGIGLPLTSGLLAPAGANLVNPQAYMDIVMRVEIPEDAKPTESNPNPFEAKFVVCVSASSNIEVADTTENWIVAVKSAEMHLANFIPPDSEDENALTKFGDPGKYVEFPLVVQNKAPANGEVDVYTLSTPVLPTGWSVTYYRDLNKNGVLDANELLPVLRSGAVAPQEKDYLIARVGISPYARADVTEPYGVQDEYPLRFRATSSNLPDLYKEQDDIVKVNWQNRFELQPNRQGTIEPNGVTIYEHTVTNYGERANRFYLTLTTGHANWTYFLLQKDNGAELPQAVDPVDGVSKHYVDLGKAGETNDKATFLLRIYAPGGTPQGTMDLTSILVTANDPGETTPTRFPGTPLHIATDVTFVVAGDLVLIKSADPAPGAPVRPGDSIEYTTTFFNKSADPLAQLTIQDQISPHTAYVLTSANKGSDPLPANLTGVTFEVSRNGGISWTADAGSGTDTSVTNIRAIFTGSLGGGAEGKFIFTVKVR